MFDYESPAQVFLGQIGWDDAEDFFFPGTEEDDGHTLVRCQLFSGRDITKPHTPDRAQGTKLVCHLAEGVLRVPPKDSRCYIVIPHGMEGAPAAGLIIATVGPGNERRRNISAGDTVISTTGGGQGAVIIKKDGSITLSTNHSNSAGGTSVFFRVSPTAFQFVAPWGRLIFDASGLHIYTESGGCTFDMGGIAIPGLPGAIADAFGGYVTIAAPAVKLNGGTVFLGAGAAHNPAMHAPVNPALPPPGSGTAYTSSLQSQTVYLAP